MKPVLRWSLGADVCRSHLPCYTVSRSGSQLIGEVRGDINKLLRQWDLFGWHRVTVYGDIKEPLIELGRALGLKIVEEA